MRIIKLLSFGILVILLCSDELQAQALGEYGRIVGGASQRQGSVNLKGPYQDSKGKTVVDGIGDASGRPVPSALVVASRQAGLYPRQDEEAEKITELSLGDILTPMGQSNGGNEWYMVKTQTGLVGWIKSADVRTEPGKKQ